MHTDTHNWRMTFNGILINVQATLSIICILKYSLQNMDNFIKTPIFLINQHIQSSDKFFAMGTICSNETATFIKNNGKDRKSWIQTISSQSRCPLFYLLMEKENALFFTGCWCIYLEKMTSRKKTFGCIYSHEMFHLVNTSIVELFWKRKTNIVLHPVTFPLIESIQVVKIIIH